MEAQQQQQRQQQLLQQPPPGGGDGQQQQQPPQPQPLDLRAASHEQLLAAAAASNAQRGVPADPFGAVLRGIPERARLRPDSTEAVTFSLGPKGLPSDSPFAKAWRKVLRGVKLSRAGKTGDPRLSKLKQQAPQGSSAGPALSHQPPQEATSRRSSADSGSAAGAAQRPASAQLVVQLPSEEVRWREKLAAFLGRSSIDLPLLAPGAPVLELSRLLIEVVNRGGAAAVSREERWSWLASWLQLDAGLGPLLGRVYGHLLEPLEADLPSGFRVAKHLDWLDRRIAERRAMGARLTSAEAVVFAADQAAAALRQLQQQQLPPPQQQAGLQAQPATQGLQQEADSAARSGAGRAQQPEPPPLGGVQAPEVCRCLELLRDAATQPELMLAQLQGKGLLRPGLHLHLPSRMAVLRERRRCLRHTGEAVVDDADEALLELLQPRSSSSLPGSDDDDSGSEGEGDAAAARASPQAQARPAASAAASAAGGAPGTGRLLDTAAHCLLLSRRALRSGPPGAAKRPALWLPGMAAPSDPAAAAAAAGGARQRKQAADGGRKRRSSGGEGPAAAVRGRRGTRRYHGRTPRCGNCRTCRNPRLKKACALNRERVAAGLPPVLPH